MIVEENPGKWKVFFQGSVGTEKSAKFYPKRGETTAPPADSALAGRILKAALVVLKNVCFENNLTLFGND